MYVDDIIIFSSSWEEHLKHLEWVLRQLHDAGLTLDPLKAFIGYSEINMLGHKVSHMGLKTQDEKIESMMSLPVPQTYHDLHATLGFFGYYRQFIESFSMIVKPLQGLLIDVDKPKTPEQPRDKQRRLMNTPLNWTPECQSAFNKVKSMLKAATALNHVTEDAEATF